MQFSNDRIGRSKAEAADSGSRCGLSCISREFITGLLAAGRRTARTALPAPRALLGTAMTGVLAVSLACSSFQPADDYQYMASEDGDATVYMMQGEERETVEMLEMLVRQASDGAVPEREQSSASAITGVGSIYPTGSNSAVLAGSSISQSDPVTGAAPRSGTSNQQQFFAAADAGDLDQDASAHIVSAMNALVAAAGGEESSSKVSLTPTPVAGAYVSSPVEVQPSATRVPTVVLAAAPVAPALPTPTAAPAKPAVTEAAVPTVAPVKPAVTEAAVPTVAPAKPAVTEAAVPTVAPAKPAVTATAVPTVAPVAVPTVQPMPAPERTEDTPGEHTSSSKGKHKSKARGKGNGKKEVTPTPSTVAVIVPGATPDPTVLATPTPASVPTAEPTAEPTPDISVRDPIVKSAIPAPEPTVEPTPDPTGIPVSEPTPEPTPVGIDPSILKWPGRLF